MGTSGWTYRHWKDDFYPPKLPQRRWLEYYQEQFRTVEINATFYRLMPESTMRSWESRATPGFHFAVKGWQTVTHYRRLHNVESVVAQVVARAELLGPHLGPILWQLPPGLHADVPLLREFLALLPSELSFAFEFRHDSWFADAVYAALEERGCGLCLYDMAGRQTPIQATSATVYLRFHGPERGYSGGYSDDELGVWAERVNAFRTEGRDVWAYFNNDVGGHAPRDAARFLSIAQV